MSFRPPAVPLVTVDPYFSIWSCADSLHHDRTRHWTLCPHDLVGLARIDGRVLRFLGKTNAGHAWRNARHPSGMRQTKVVVNPTTTICTFRDAEVELVVKFTTPLLADDLDLMSRPFSYVEFAVSSTDGEQHDVEIYFEVSPAIASSDSETSLVWQRQLLDSGWTSLCSGTWQQDVLGHRGDLTTIDWGYVHLFAPEGAESRIANNETARLGFTKSGSVGGDDETLVRRGLSISDGAPSLTASWKLITGPKGAKSGEVPHNSSALAILGYDDVASIDYFGIHRRAYCFRGGESFTQIAEKAIVEWPQIKERCEAFDRKLITSAEDSGGSTYADLTSLAYRQSIAAHKLIADEAGEPVFLSKECTSNGSIGTVDVSYPSSPLYLLLSPELLAGMLRPVFRFATTEAWSAPYAPHDVGTYPRATGQTYGVSMGQIDFARQMPVEESGNMLIMTAAYTQRSESTALAQEFWVSLEQWADYLVEHGLDPENQLCTDDFAGHLAHNTNLSLKAIIGIACFGFLCKETGREDHAARYSKIAHDYATQWTEKAVDGDHYRLTFDGPGTWSLKYNLVWDRYFGFGLFPDAVAESEVAYYLSNADEYGVPLDSRAPFTKTDWLIWAATLAPDKNKRSRFIDFAWKFANETIDRAPFSDWYDTHDAREQSFHNRTVIGGIFMPLLFDTFGTR